MKYLRILLLLIFYSSFSHAENLMQVYQQALLSDPTFHKIVSQQLAKQQAVPISFSNLYPSLTGSVSPTIVHTQIGNVKPQNINNTQRGCSFNVSLTQTVFDVATFVNTAQAKSISKQADAIIHAAQQDLLLRTAKAYFAMLYEEDNVHYNTANQALYRQQWQNAQQEYRAGTKTLTDVYTVQAAYASASASSINAHTQLEKAKENLRAITGKYYSQLAKLPATFPLTPPQPEEVETWVNQALQQNWSLKASRYGVNAARNQVKQQAGGNFPTLQIQGYYDYNIGSIANNAQLNSPSVIPGILRSTQWGVMLVVNIPIFQGGYVTASTQQAQYQYQSTYHRLEQETRRVISQTHQYYLAVISDIHQLQADQKAILAGKNSLEGLRENYKTGTQSLVDVLNQQQKLFHLYLDYAQDRYDYLYHLLQLKAIAGILSPLDLEELSLKKSQVSLGSKQH